MHNTNKQLTLYNITGTGHIQITLTDTDTNKTIQECWQHVGSSPYATDV